MNSQDYANRVKVCVLKLRQFCAFFAVILIMGAAINMTNFCTMAAVSERVSMGGIGHIRVWMVAIGIAIAVVLHLRLTIPLYFTLPLYKTSNFAG